MSADAAMSVDERALEQSLESLEEELATMEPEELRALIEQVFAPLQIGFGTTTIWMWHQVWRLWKR